MQYFAICKRFLKMSCQKFFLNKLEYYSIRGFPLNWFLSYLTDRKIMIKLIDYECTVSERVYSKSMPLGSGVPQGSILVPLLLLLYISDLVANFQSAYFILLYNTITIIKTIILKNYFRTNHLFCSVYKWFMGNRHILTNNITFQISNYVPPITPYSQYGELVEHFWEFA